MAAMPDFEWCLIDTEVTGIEEPIFILEIAAQRMRGWRPVGAPLVRLLNHRTDIPEKVSRVNGYTREILERDGHPPAKVHEELAKYAGRRPIGAYNLAYDWDKILVPEWQRLGLDLRLQRGFCMLKLAQRLLDPSPAGNHKLQTLRQFYRLSARGAHTALGDVQTVADLLEQVLEPLCEARALRDPESVRAFLERPWFPSRIPFGKFKGHDYRDARSEPAVHQWLEWLAECGADPHKMMGAWYLEHLNVPPAPVPAAPRAPSAKPAPEQVQSAGPMGPSGLLPLPKVAPLRPPKPIQAAGPGSSSASAPAGSPRDSETPPPALPLPIPSPKQGESAQPQPSQPAQPSLDRMFRPPDASPAGKSGPEFPGGRRGALLLLAGGVLVVIGLLAGWKGGRSPVAMDRGALTAMAPALPPADAEADIDIPAIPRATLPAAAPIRQTAPSVRMFPPPAGSNRVYSRPEIAYCLGEQIRLETMERLISAEMIVQERKFSTLLDDYKSRCLNYRYDPDVLQMARQDIEAVRPRLMAEAISALRTWR